MDEDGFFGTIKLTTSFMGGFNKFVRQYATDSLGEAAFNNQGGNYMNFIMHKGDEKDLDDNDKRWIPALPRFFQ